MTSNSSANSPAGNPASTGAGAASAAQTQGVQFLAYLGSVVLWVVWALEMRAGLINPWDVWAEPLLATALLAHGMALRRWPEHTLHIRASGCLLFTAYLALSVLMLLFSDLAPTNGYQFFSALYWLPLTYGTCFLYLPQRWALWVACGVFGITFGPMAVAALNGTARSHWPEDFPTLVAVLAGAQVAYIAMLRTVATVRAEHHAAEQRADLLQTLASTDVLTELPNRRGMVNLLQNALAQAHEQPQPLALALFDVDHFKQINDSHGHSAGDAALVAMGRLLSAPLQSPMCVGRWGGEEFLLLAPGTQVDALRDLAEQLRMAVGRHAFAHGERVTTSVGLAVYQPGDDADSLLQRADRALYRAKAAGRNRTHGPDAPLRT